MLYLQKNYIQRITSIRNAFNTSYTISNIIFIEELLSNTKKSVVAVKKLKKITDEKRRSCKNN